MGCFDGEAASGSESRVGVSVGDTPAGSLTTVSLSDHVLPTGLDEVHSEVVRVSRRVGL